MIQEFERAYFTLRNVWCPEKIESS